MFILGEDYSSEISLGGGITENEETNIVNSKISERTEGEDTVPLFQILFIEVGGRGICGWSVEGGSRLCMSLMEEFNAVSHNRSRESGKYIPGGKEGACVVMALSSTHIPSSAFFQTLLSGATYSNVKRFEGLLWLSYTLGKWETKLSS